MTTPRQRTLVAGFSSAVARFRVFALPNALEIEERSGKVQRHRVLFVETQLLTLHQARQWIAPALLLVIASISGLLGWALSTDDEPTAALVAFLVAALCLVPGIIMLAIPKHIVTITSRRSQAEIQFGMRRARARQWFDQLQAEVRRAQEACATEVAAQNATLRSASIPAGEALPLPPSL